MPAEVARTLDPLRPLADRMRPASLDEFVGQEHLLAKGKPLREAIEAGQLHSMILWGPPGTGKTTLARLIARRSGAQFIALSAVMAGVKDIIAKSLGSSNGINVAHATIEGLKQLRRPEEIAALRDQPADHVIPSGTLRAYRERQREGDLFKTEG